jgi:hypothetical protein
MVEETRVLCVRRAKWREVRKRQAAVEAVLLGGKVEVRKKV